MRTNYCCCAMSSCSFPLSMYVPLVMVLSRDSRFLRPWWDIPAILAGASHSRDMSCSDCGDLDEAGPGSPLVQALPSYQSNSSSSDMGPGPGPGKCCCLPAFECIMELHASSLLSVCCYVYHFKICFHCLLQELNKHA